MDQDYLRFACPRCGVDLTVPASVAGAEGPCPRCGGLIRAPHPASRAADSPVRLEVRDEPVIRAKPVAFQPALEQTFVESTAMIADRRASTRRTLLVILIVMIVAGVLAWVLVSRSREAELNAPPVITAKAKNLDPEPEEENGPVLKDPALDLAVPPVGLDVQAFVASAADVLSKFLIAPSLEQRLPFIEGKASKEEMEKSVLAGSLGANGKFESLEVKFDKLIGTNEVIFKAESVGADGIVRECLIMVRARGGQQPKVVVDPFLDSFGGRFAAFAATPREGQGKFRLVVAVFPFCADESIPGHEGKYTVKFMSAPGMPDLGKAYFGKQSPLREKLEKLGMVQGRSTGVTVSVRWNTETFPYLEVVDIPSLDWND